MNSALFNLAFAEREDLEQSERFLCLLVAGNILDDYLRFAVLGDNERLSLFGQLPYDFRGVSFQVADGLDLAR